MKKAVVLSICFIILLVILATVGSSLYMLDYSLAPDPHRTDTAAHFRELFSTHPETRPWIDS